MAKINKTLPKRTRGRPRMHVERHVRISISVTPSVRDILFAAGGGNVSAGVHWLVASRRPPQYEEDPR